MSKQPSFVGRKLRKHDFKCVISLIELTVGRIGVHKRHFKTEAAFWSVIETVTGRGPIPGESFELSLHRVAGYVRGLSREKKLDLLAHADQAVIFAAVEISKPDEVLVKEATARLPSARQPRKPRAPRVAKVRKSFVSKGTTPTVSAKDEFYRSWEWRTLRLEIIKEQGRECQCCGSRPGMFYASGEPVRICVDHIKPISKHWHLRLVKTNLQVLCDECNMGKGNWDETDFRPTAPDEWIVADNDDIALTVLNEMATGQSHSDEANCAIREQVA